MLLVKRGNLILMPRIHGYLALIAAARGDVRAAEVALGLVQSELTSQHPHFGAEFVAYAASVMAEIDGRPADALELLSRFWYHDALTRTAIRTGIGTGIRPPGHCPRSGCARA